MFATIISKILSWACQEVAVKILTEQDFHPERVNEFLREVFSGRYLNYTCSRGVDYFVDSSFVFSYFCMIGCYYEILATS